MKFKVKLVAINEVFVDADSKEEASTIAYGKGFDTTDLEYHVSRVTPVKEGE